MVKLRGRAWGLIAIAVWLTVARIPAANAAAFRVALILPGPADDRGWSQAAYEGLMQVRARLGAQVAYRERVPEGAAEAVFRDYARAGYEFIVGDGGEYVRAAERVSREFPRTRFAIVGHYAGNNRNLGALGFRVAEAGYLCGVVAALKTRTNQVAHMGGEPLPMAREAALAFERGVRATKPSVKIALRWVGSWTDPAKGETVAKELVARGADFLSLDADLANAGAVKAAERSGVYAITWANDYREVAPRTVVATVVERVQTLVLGGAMLALQRRWEGKQYQFGFREGAVDVIPRDGMLAPDQIRRFDAVKEGIRLGRIDVSGTAPRRTP